MGVARYFEQQILSCCMTESVTMTLYGVKEGKVYQGASFTTTAAELALKKIPSYVESGDMARAKAMVDMLNFGAEIQLAYNYNKENLANANLGDLAKYGSTEKPEMNAVNDITGTEAVKVYVNNISMQSKVEFQFLVLTSDLEGKTVVAKRGEKDAAVSYTPYAEVYTIIRVACEASYMRDGYTFMLTDAEGNAVTKVYNINVVAYAAEIAKTAEKEAAMLAMISYGDSVAQIK